MIPTVIIVGNELDGVHDALRRLASVAPRDVLVVTRPTDTGSTVPFSFPLLNSTDTATSSNIVLGREKPVPPVLSLRERDLAQAPAVRRGIEASGRRPDEPRVAPVRPTRFGRAAEPAWNPQRWSKR